MDIGHDEGGQVVGSLGWIDVSSRDGKVGHMSYIDQERQMDVKNIDREPKEYGKDARSR